MKKKKNQSHKDNTQKKNPSAEKKTVQQENISNPAENAISQNITVTSAPKKLTPALFIEKAGLYIVCLLSLFIGLWLSVVSLVSTVTVDNIKEGENVTSILYYIVVNNESVIYYNDNFFINILLLAVSILALYFLSSKLSRIRLRYKLLFLFLWTFALGTIWVISSQSAPNTDSQYIANSASAFSKGNLTFLNDGVYFKQYPFQLGYVFFCEIIVKVVNTFFSPQNQLYLEVMNAFFLGAINVLVVMITDLTIKDRKVTTAAALILAASCAPILSCSFIYGIFPGLFFALVALYCELRYIMDNKIFLGALSVFCIAIAVMIKSNYLICMIAIVLVWIVMMFRRKKYVVDCIFIVCAIILSLSVQPAVKSMYESRSGADLGEGIPYSAWIAMGLNESQSSPGWFNPMYTTSKFAKNEYNSEITDEQCKEIISDRIRNFCKKPQYTTDFFHKKIVSQWNETSYESIWTNIIRFQYKDKNAFADWVCNKGDKKVKKYMDLWAQLLFFAFTAGIAVIFKKRNFLASSFAVIFLGGFFFQMLSEAKSQYILPYIIIMSGIAAYGLIISGEHLSAFIKNKLRRSKTA